MSTKCPLDLFNQYFWSEICVFEKLYFSYIWLSAEVNMIMFHKKRYLLKKIPWQHTFKTFNIYFVVKIKEK